MNRLFSLVLLGALFSRCVSADIVVQDAWVRATPPGAKNAAVYFTLLLDEGTDELVGGQTPVAWAAEVHAHVHEGGMMRMEQIPGLPVEAGKPASLSPGGNHLMLLGLKHALDPGMDITLTLHFKHEKALTLSVPVRDGRKPEQ